MNGAMKTHNRHPNSATVEPDGNADSICTACQWLADGFCSMPCKDCMGP